MSPATLPPWAVPALLGLAGLLAGGAINLVVERLPRQMERAWWADIGAELADASGWTRVFRTARPAACAQMVADIDAAFERTIDEHMPRSPLRRLAVSLATALLFAMAAWRFGTAAATMARCVALALLVALALIDFDTRLLPDGLTLTLLWAGLIAAELHWTIPLSAAVWGAVAGYLALWILATPFKWISGREGIAPGDFKLLAALGAWLGWQAILPIALLACVAGAAVGLTSRAAGHRGAGEPIPFGPFLAAGGVATMFAGVEHALHWIGLR